MQSDECRVQSEEGSGDGAGLCIRSAFCIRHLAASLAGFEDGLLEMLEQGVIGFVAQ